MEKEPRVLIGCPTHEVKEECLEEYIEGLYGLSYKNFDVCLQDNSEGEKYFEKLEKIAEKWNGKKKQNFSVIRSGSDLEKARERIVFGRNELRKKVLKEKYDYFLSLEQDVIPPIDIIERLVSHGKDIVSAVYFVPRENRGALEMVAYKLPDTEEAKQKEWFPHINFLELIPSRLIGELAFTGLGCVLISRNVLQKVKFRYDPKQGCCDDRHFGIDARKNGFKIYLDSSMLAKHIFYSKPWGAIARAEGRF